MNLYLSKFRHWFEQNEKYLSPGALLLGFIIDNLTLRRIDLFFENFVLASYIAIATCAIVVINLIDTNVLKGEGLKKFQPYLFLLIQFSFGGLFSGFFVFYSRSASFVSSWPFLIILGGVLLSTEFLKNHYTRFVLQISILFLALYSFLIFYLPIIFNRLGADIFILSGLASLLLIGVFLLLLSKMMPHRVAESKRKIATSVAVLFFTINGLYFLNIIPPIPLSLKEIGIYHRISSQVDGSFILSGEKKKLTDIFRPKTLHLRRGEQGYVWSAVFAPTRLSTDVIHNWQYFDEKKEDWVSLSKVHYSLIGGRDGGYRGYSYKGNMLPGRWRVDIETERGQIIGRIKFNVEIVSGTPELVQSVK